MIEIYNGEQATLQEHQEACLSILKEFDRVCKALNIPYILFAGTLLGAIRHGGFIPWDDDLDVLMLRGDYERFLTEADHVLNQERFYLQKEFSKHWPMFFSKLRMNNTACLEKYHANDPEEHHGIYIDIFPCDNAAGSRIGQRIQFYSSKVVIAKALGKRGYETDNAGKKVFMKICTVLPMSLFRRIVKGNSKDSKYVHSFFGSASSFSKNIYLRKMITPRTVAEFEGEHFPVPVNCRELLQIMYGDYMKIPSEAERACKKHAVLVDVRKSYKYYEEYHKSLVFLDYTRSIR